MTIATEIDVLTITVTAGTGGLTARRWVTPAGTRATLDAVVMGVATHDASEGDDAAVRVIGLAVVEAGGVVSVGDPIGSDALGRAVVVDGDDVTTARAYARTAATAAGQEISMLLVGMPGPIGPTGDTGAAGSHNALLADGAELEIGQVEVGDIGTAVTGRLFDTYFHGFEVELGDDDDLLISTGAGGESDAVVVKQVTSATGGAIYVRMADSMLCQDLGGFGDRYVRTLAGRAIRIVDINGVTPTAPTYYPLTMTSSPDAFVIGSGADDDIIVATDTEFAFAYLAV